MVGGTIFIVGFQTSWSRRIQAMCHIYQPQTSVQQLSDPKGRLEDSTD